MKVQGASVLAMTVAATVSTITGNGNGNAVVSVRRPQDGLTGPTPPPEAPEAASDDESGASQPTDPAPEAGDDVPADTVDWRLLTRDTAEQVRAITSDLPDDGARQAVGRILAWVADAHHTKINVLVDEQYLPAPIDLRRMLATIELVDRFVAGGELPE